MQTYRLVSAGLSVGLALACVAILEAQRGTQQEPTTPPGPETDSQETAGPGPPLHEEKKV